MFPTKVFPDTTAINDHGQLVIGGCNVLEIVEEFNTPVYVLDEKTIRNRC